MGKKYDQIIVLFAVILIALNFITGGSAAESKKSLVRQKRNIVCLLRLTGLVSNIFYNSLKEIRKNDPVPIGSLKDGKLENGVFEGLSSLRNDSSINVTCVDELVVLSTNLGVSEASVTYEWTQKLLLLSKSGSVWTKVKNIQFALELALNMTRGVKLDVTNLKVTEMDGLKFGFNGLGPVNPVIRIFGNLVLKVWERKIPQAIEKLLGETLEAQLSDFKIF